MACAHKKLLRGTQTGCIESRAGGADLISDLSGVQRKYKQRQTDADEATW